jgi:hypothetical protein
LQKKWHCKWERHTIGDAITKSQQYAHNPINFILSFMIIILLYNYLFIWLLSIEKKAT